VGSARVGFPVGNGVDGSGDGAADGFSVIPPPQTQHAWFALSPSRPM